MASSCSAARAGIASFQLGLLPFMNFKIAFIGTGTAKLQYDIEFARLTSADTVHMEWINNRFVGRHWLLGRFIIELNPDRKSIGRVEGIKRIQNKNQGLNTNEFYFTFKFPRLLNLVISNRQPIVNSSVVFNIPPTEESVYKLEEKNRSIKVGYARGKETTLNFNFCDITLFPERNISVEVVAMTKSTANSYLISVLYTNLTSVTAICAFFLVIHDTDLITPDDYGLKSVGANDSFLIVYKVSHKRINIQVDLSIFGGLYLPEYLRGSCQTNVLLDF